jgi:hypothetical protein
MRQSPANTPPLMRSRGVLCCRMVGPAPAALSPGVSGLLLPRAGRPKRLAARNWPVFGGVLESLRGLLPAAFPVVVRAASLPPDTLGYCHRTDERFVIRLADRLSEPEAVEVLLHEWAHALAWNHALDRLATDADVHPETFEAGAHDGAWGVAFSQVWRAYAGVIVPGLGRNEA